MSRTNAKFDHQAAEDRAAVRLGWAYWSREWHRRRERAMGRTLSLVQRQEALRCQRVAAYWLERLGEGGPLAVTLQTGEP